MPQTLPKKVSEISDSTGVLMHQSITKDHYLRQKNDTEIPIVHETHFFYGFLVWTSVALLILSFVRYSKKFRLWLRALFSLSSARTLEREDFKVVQIGRAHV